jgi:predicted DNA binding CopG/RHH family protein
MKKTIKSVPIFKSEDEERKFWESHDAGEFFDESSIVEAKFVNLKPSTKKMTIRVPEEMINNLKIIANMRDVPYQSYVKIKLDEIIKKEMSGKIWK